MELNQGQAQPGLAAPMPAPSLAQNLQGIGQGQQARESILSLLQGALATALNPKPMQPASAAPASQLFPPTSLPGGYPSAQVFCSAILLLQIAPNIASLLGFGTIVWLISSFICLFRSHNINHRSQSHELWHVQSDRICPQHGSVEFASHRTTGYGAFNASNINPTDAWSSSPTGDDAQLTDATLVWNARGESLSVNQQTYRSLSSSLLGGYYLSTTVTPEHVRLPLHATFRRVLCALQTGARQLRATNQAPPPRLSVSSCSIRVLASSHRYRLTHFVACQL